MTEEKKLNRCSKHHIKPILFPAGCYARQHYVCPICNDHDVPDRNVDIVDYWNKTNRSPLDDVEQLTGLVEQLNEKVETLERRISFIERYGIMDRSCD